ncbi:MAG: DUF1491 family protein [Cucumibacter sp.]
MARLRSEIWVAAFVRRHAQQGRICVITRKGDPSAGQIWIEVDHLNGTVSLFVPAPAGLESFEDSDRTFMRRFDRASPEAVGARVLREAGYDPDLWVVTLESRDTDVGLNLTG